METAFEGSVYTAHTLGKGLALCGRHAGPGRAAGIDALGCCLDWRCTCLRAIVLRRGGAIGQPLRSWRICNRRSLRSCCRRRFRARRLGLIGLCAIDASLLGGWICGCGRRGGRGLLVSLGAAARQLARQLQAHALGLGRTECVGEVFIRPGGHRPAGNLAGGRICRYPTLGCLLLGWRACSFLSGLGHGIGLLDLRRRAGVHGNGSSCGQRAGSRVQAHGLRRAQFADGSVYARGIELRCRRDALLAQPCFIDHGLLLGAQLAHEFVADLGQAGGHFAIGLVLADLLEQIWAESLVQRVRRSLPVLGRQALVLSARQRITVLLLALGPDHLVDGRAVGCNIGQAHGLCAGLGQLSWSIARLTSRHPWLAHRPIPRRATAHGRARQRAQHHR
ncbi:hypothetical protein ACMFLR_30610, partial [Delftia tsuruhatensis]